MASQPRDPEQHMEALRLANNYRAGQAVVRREVKAGRMGVVRATQQECMRNIPVREVLLAQHRWGSARALMLMASAGIPEFRTCGELTYHQRGRLQEELEETREP